jgi:hypothetical protein
MIEDQITNITTLVGFEVLTKVVWDIAPCSPLKVNRRFGGTCRLHLQGRRISRARNQREIRWQAEQSACRNFRLYRKQKGNGYPVLVSYWFARLYLRASGYWRFILFYWRASQWPITQLATCFHVGFLLGLFFDPED